MQAGIWRRGNSVPRMAWSWRGGSVVALLVVVVGLGLALRPQQSAPSQSAPLAPDFTLPVAMNGGLRAASGATMDLRALRGHPVLLNFFNTTCGPCLDEMATLRKTAQSYRARGVIVLGVATFGDTVATARRLAATAHLPYPILVDNQVSAWQYDVSGLPTSFFLDAQGHAVGQQIGPLTASVIRDGLAQAGAISCAGCAHVEPLGMIGSDTGSPRALDADIVYPKPSAAPAFALRDQQGRLITPASLRGQVVALTFISARCIQQCPLIGKTLSLVRAQLGRDAARMTIVAISVDPEQDAPAYTRQFAAESGWGGTNWHYLTAPRSVLTHIWGAYGMDVPAPAPIFKPGQTIVHQAGLFLIDPRGRVRAYDTVPLLVSRVAASIRALLPA